MEQSLMEKFADPALFESLGMGEKLVGALITMLMGMGITFIVLIMLWGIIALTTKLINRNTETNSKKAEAPALVASAGSQTETPAVTVRDSEGTTVTDGELVAVITTAIEAYENGTAVQSNLVVRKIDRTVGRSTAWSRAGAQATIDSRFI